MKVMMMTIGILIVMIILETIGILIMTGMIVMNYYG